MTVDDGAVVWDDRNVHLLAAEKPMKVRLCSLLILAVASLAFAPAPLPRPERRPRVALPSMEGRWQGHHQLLVTPTHLIYNPDTTKTEYELVVDRTAQPATYDLRFPRDGRVSWKGIWKVEGDTLTLYYRQASEGRPTRFERDRGISEVYKRVRR
jgi:uncharacterized protein (TIGR03067 family)